MDPVAGWYDDPTGRHEHRYWDGSQWSDRVRDQGSESVDRLAGGPPGGDAAVTDTAAAGADLPAEPEPEDRADTGTPWTAPGDASPTGSASAATTGGFASGTGAADMGAGGPSDRSPGGGGEVPLAGWYPDPWTPGQQRYWDGNQWTEHTHQPSGAGGTQGYASSGYGGATAGTGGTGGGYAAARETNALAIWALVLGILTFFCWITWIGALITGYMAKRQIESSGGREEGRGMAIAGIVLGWIGAAGTIIFLILLVVGIATVPMTMGVSF